MKKGIMTILLIVATLSQSLAQQSRNDMGESSGKRIAAFHASEQNNMFISENKDGITLSVAGYGIELGTGRANSVEGATIITSGRERKIRCKLTLLSNMKFGFTTLTAMDYSNYGVEDKNFLDLRVGKSNLFGFDIFGFKFDSGTLGLRTGISLLTYNLTFANSLTLTSNDGVISPQEIATSYKKSKLALSYITLPVVISFKLAKEFYIEPSLYAGVNINSHTKYKRPITKSSYLSGVNQYVTGGSLRIKYRSFGIFCDYNFSPLFNPDSAPRTNALSIGVSYQ